MSNQYFNFYYSPTRQGFDASIWHTLFGGPAVSSGGRLLITDSAFVHYGDILRGDAVFNMNVPAPAGGLSRKFGFYQPNKNAYAYFKISGAAFTAECSDGTNSTSSVIAWQTAWTNTNTEFRVKWEAGTATFFVGGVQQAVIQDISVSGDPMSLYVANETSDTIFLNYIDVKTIQSYILNEGNEDTVFGEKYVYVSDIITVADVPTMFMTILIAGEGVVADGVTLTESVTLLLQEFKSLSDTLTISESVTVAVV